MSETDTLTAARTPTVYFIDDSATMREVIKIAFRKENIQVITCPDAASAIAQFGRDCARCGDHRRDHAGQGWLRSLPVHQAARTICAHARDSDVGRGESHGRRKSDGGESRRADSQAVSAARPDRPGEGPAPSHSVSSFERRNAGERARAEQALECTGRPLLAWRRAGSANAFGWLRARQRRPRLQRLAATRGIARSHASPKPAAPAAADIQRLRNEILRLELLVKKLQAELEAAAPVLRGPRGSLQEPPGIATLRASRDPPLIAPAQSRYSFEKRQLPGA